MAKKNIPIKKDVEYHFKKVEAHKKADGIIKSKIKYTIFIDYVINTYNHSHLLEIFEHKENAIQIKEELIKKYHLKDIGYSAQFQEMIDEKRPQADGPFYLILVKSDDIPL